MGNVGVAFEFNDEDKIPRGHKQIVLHIVFDIKMDSLQRKSRLVADGSRTNPLKSITFSTIVTRDSVQIFFLLCALNDLSVL